MANTRQMFLAGLALVINTTVIAVMYFAGNVIIAPIVDVFGRYVTSSSLIPMWQMTYIIPFIWALLLCFEVMSIIAFFVVAARRTVVDDVVY